MDELRVLQGEIAARCAQVADGHGDWPCRQGCDLCCHRLAAIPELSLAEWEAIREVIAGWGEEAVERTARKNELLFAFSAPYVCPFLDRDQGLCEIYEVRPIACRTYGFYVERGIGLYCGIIEGMTDRGECDRVVWGNAESVEGRLAALGERRSLLEWVRAGILRKT